MQPRPDIFFQLLLILKEILMNQRVNNTEYETEQCIVERGLDSTNKRELTV